ncbi:MAG: hypothetical protein HY275_15575, partial [Gemmatimonadetes bacterium]|nr:hypothetical protein [Gemmatimonadota bacterium]
MPDAAHHTRREFLALLGAGSGALIAACDGAFTLPTRTPPDTSHLAARRQPPTGTVTPGLHPLGLATGRDGALYVPAGYAPTMSAPLIILCHGAGGSSTQWTGDTN